MAKYLTTRPAKYLLRVLLRAKYLQVRLSVSIPSYLWLILQLYALNKGSRRLREVLQSQRRPLYIGHSHD